MRKARKAMPQKGSGVQTSLDRISVNLKSELAALKATAIATRMHPNAINSARKAIYARARNAELGVGANQILQSMDVAKAAVAKQGAPNEKGVPVGKVCKYTFRSRVPFFMQKKRDEHVEMLSRHLKPGGVSNPENQWVFDEIARLQLPVKQVSAKSFSKPGLPAKGRLYKIGVDGSIVPLQRPPDYFVSDEPERVIRGKMAALYQVRPKATVEFRQPRKKRAGSGWRPGD